MAEFASIVHLLHHNFHIFPYPYHTTLFPFVQLLFFKQALGIQRYDEASDVDYWKTLRCYLDAERSIAHAAKALNIHRNTMIQRIERIESILEMDLDDPMGRLWLRMAMWLVDEEDSRKVDIDD